MNLPASIKGLQGTAAKFAKRALGYDKANKDALFAVGLYLQGESQRLAPTECGNLRASATTQKVGDGSIVRVGYTSRYALWVHENVEMKLRGKKRHGKKHRGFYWDPQGIGQAKFLEKPFREKQPEMRQLYKDVMKKALK